MAIWVAVYFTVYGALAWRGCYIDGNFGGSDNRSVWYPAFCGEAYQSPNRAAALFTAPTRMVLCAAYLIFDRLMIHPTRFNAY